jgi:hypothetical protein
MRSISAAELVGPELRAVVTFDRRLAVAAKALGSAVEEPA